MNQVVTAATMIDDIRNASKDYGTTATYTVLPTTVDVGTSSRSGTGTGHTVQISSPAEIDAEQVNGTTVLQGDKETFLGAKGEITGGAYIALTFTPSAGDTLTVGSTVYSITEVSSGSYSGTKLGYLLRLRS